MTKTHESTDLFPASPAAGQDAPHAPPVHEMRMPDDGAPADSLGRRLRASRRAKGMAIGECAQRLHLPIKVLERLEADDLGPPDQFVFLRGPLTSYARLLDVPQEACNVALRKVAPASQPALTTVARVSHSRWLLQRYGTATTYIVLTAFIAVPLVLLGLRGGLDRAPARIVSLDHAPAPSAAAGRAQSSPDASPFRASMAPFAAMDIGESADSATAAVAPAPASTATAPGSHGLTLTASGDCWYEITGSNGESVASGMLRAGDTRSWPVSGELHVTLGNADAVSVTRDGHAFALDAYKHANVARFDVSGGAVGGARN